jgi:hypothetical protein
VFDFFRSQPKNYQQYFETAVRRTKRMKLEVTPIQYRSNETYITQDKIEEFPYALRREFGEIEISDMAIQCLGFNFDLQPFVANYFNCPVYYTLGDILFNSGSLYNADEKKLKKWLKFGYQRFSPGVQLHAWLTLPSMEVIDLTIATSYALINGRPENAGGIIASHPDFLPFKFKPLLIGTEYLERIGAIGITN